MVLDVVIKKERVHALSFFILQLNKTIDYPIEPHPTTPSTLIEEFNMVERKNSFQPTKAISLTTPVLNTDFVPPIPTIPWTATFLVDVAGGRGSIIEDFDWLPNLEIWASRSRRQLKNHIARSCCQYHIGIHQINGDELILDAILTSQLIQDGDNDNKALAQTKRIFPDYVSFARARKLIKELTLNTDRLARLKQNAIAVQKHTHFDKYRSFV